MAINHQSLRTRLQAKIDLYNTCVQNKIDQFRQDAARTANNYANIDDGSLQSRFALQRVHAIDEGTYALAIGASGSVVSYFGVGAVIDFFGVDAALHGGAAMSAATFRTALGVGIGIAFSAATAPTSSALAVNAGIVATGVDGINGDAAGSSSIAAGV